MAAHWPRSKVKNTERTRSGEAGGHQPGKRQKQQTKKKEWAGPEIEITALQAFIYGEKAVRAVEKDGSAWLVAADVCDVLDIANSRDAVEKLDDDEKGVALTDTLGGRQRLSVISESGALYLIFRSDKPEAKAFRRWVTGVVLPSVLRTGSYNGPSAGGSNSPHITLPGPGCYIAHMTKDGQVVCQPATQEEAAERIFFAEGRVLVHMLKLIQAHWSIVQQSRLFEDDPQPILGAGPLHQAITEGSRLADDFLPCWDLTARRQP